jgi:hypothetical protein
MPQKQAIFEAGSITIAERSSTMARFVHKLSA